MIRSRPRLPCSRWRSSEVALALFDLHRAFFVVVDHAVFTLRAAERNHLLNNFGNRVRFGANRTRARNAAERPHAADDPLLLLAFEDDRVVVDHDDRAVADHDIMLLREIERYDGNFLEVDVKPDVRLRPV